MERIQFPAKPRTETGKGFCYRMRQAGLVPGVLYGAGGKNQLIVLDRKTAETRLKEIKGHSVIADLVLDENGKTQTYKTIIKEIQKNPITLEVLHLDFNIIRSDKPVVMEIPISLTGTGDSPGVKEGGILEHQLRELKVEGLPDRIPDSIAVDVSTLEMGKTILVSDILVPEGIRILTEKQRAVVTVVAPKIEEVVEAAAPVVTEEAAQPEVITQEIAEERRKEKEAKKTAETPEKEKEKDKEKDKEKKA